MRTAAKTAFLLALITLGSKLIGFVREILMANYYGASYVVDAYYIANSVPSMIFAGILTATATSFIPIYSQKDAKEGRLQANLFMSQTINLLFIIALISSLVGIIFSDQLVSIFASGFEGETAELASFYVKITFSYTLFNAVGGILDSYLRYQNIFLSSAIAGYSISISCVVFIIISHHTNPYFLIFGMLVGYAVRTLILWVIAKFKGYKHKMNFHISDAVKEIFRLAVPVFIGTTVGQINLILHRSLASGLAEGSASALSYSDLLLGLLTGITTTIIATILYPKMAQAYASKDILRFSSLYNSGISILLMIGIPISIGAMVYGRDVIQIIYERGAFDAYATDMTFHAFFYYGMGFLATALGPFLIETYYSMHNTKTPLVIAIIGITVNIVFMYTLIKPMAHAGLALSGTISNFVQIALLLWYLNHNTDLKLTVDITRKALKLLVSSVVSIGISYLFYYFVGNAIWMPRAILIMITIFIAVIFYLLLLKLLRIPEFVHVKEIFHIVGGPSADEPKDNPFGPVE